MSDTLVIDGVVITPELAEAFAHAAQIGGGRHAFRVKNDDIRARAQSLADVSRKDRRTAARHARNAERKADAAILRAWNGYAPESVCDLTRHTAECCAFGRLVAVWSVMPTYGAMRTMARQLFRAAEIDREKLPTHWRALVRAYAAGKREAAIHGAFAISRDDMRADNRSRFYKRAAYLLSLQDGVNVAASAEDVVQDAFVSSLESGDSVRVRVRDDVYVNVPTFGTTFRHVKSSAVSAVWRYRRMGHRPSENVRAWTWNDWQAWAAENDGADRFAHSTNAEWQAFDAARLVVQANAAHRKFVEDRRDADAASLDSSLAGLHKLIRAGVTVAGACKVMGRNPETILSEIESARSVLSTARRV